MERHGTARLSAQPGREEELQSALRAVIDDVVSRPGITGAHLLRTRAPAIAQTVEQQIRGGADRSADWILFASGYEQAALQELPAGYRAILVLHDVEGLSHEECAAILECRVGTCKSQLH